MEPLFRWLLIGFIVSLLFILIARWFWKRYDRPSDAAIEWQKEQEENRIEREVWHSVEMEMRREAVEAERKADFQMKRQAAARSGTAPDAGVVAQAFESLGGVPKQAVVNEFEVDNKVVESSGDEPTEPDWELVERLKRISDSNQTEELPHPGLPFAPSLPDVDASVSEE